MATQADRSSLYSPNRLKLGLFGANCSSGRAVTKVPERWSGTWPDCLRLARLADELGFEFMLPVGRWKGYGGDTDYQGETLETITWAAGLLAATQRITVFGTVHAPLIHPVIAAKQFVTADQIGAGRFGLNVVCGWNEDEFEMFGATMRDHEARYEYAQEWLDAVRLCWSSREEFDFPGRYVKLRQVRAKPKPFGDGRPVVMNAGASAVGQAFAVRNCDALFSMTPKGKLEEFAAHVRRVKAQAYDVGRELDVFTVAVVTCRNSNREAEEYYRHCVIDNADWTAVDRIMAMRGVTRERFPDDFEERRRHQANGMGGVPVVGDPDHVAGELATIAQAGARGIALSFVNYLDEVSLFAQEVMPRLARMGWREMHML
ncbi:MAG TPA: LLM class flavin-dependent oxidoreductase [Acetobacteraceae bacterium]|nr:LLM class flavin-dependent oxidoreductase [Acetobacteraceae bacterium]